MSDFNLEAENVQPVKISGVVAYCIEFDRHGFFKLNNSLGKNCTLVFRF